MLDVSSKTGPVLVLRTKNQCSPPSALLPSLSPLLPSLSLFFPFSLSLFLYFFLYVTNVYHAINLPLPLPLRGPFLLHFPGRVVPPCRLTRVALSHPLGHFMN